MKYKGRYILIVTLLWGSLFFNSQAQAKALSRTIDFRVMPLSNLFYQIDCLAGQGHCSESVYRELWDSLEWDQRDQEALKRWVALKSKYQQQIFFPSSQTFKTDLPGRFEGFSMWKKIRLASLNAKNMKHFQSQMGLIMRPNDAAELTLLMGYWEPRFMSWWSQGPEKTLQKQAGIFAKLLFSPAIRSLLSQAEAFYEADFQGHVRLNFNLMYRPQNKYKNVNGEQVENNSIVEVLEDKDPREVLDIVVHELCHYYYRSAPYLTHLKTIQGFTSQKSRAAMGSYNLLNEALATAIGNGLISQTIMSEDKFQRYISTPKSFYNDTYIDQAAKALMPELKKYLNQKQKLSQSEVIQNMSRIMKSALKSSLTRPEVLLKTMALGTPSNLNKGFIYQAISPRSTWGADIHSPRLLKTLISSPAMSALIFMPLKDLYLLKDWQGLLSRHQIRQLTSIKTPSVYTFPKSNNSNMYFITGDTPTDFKTGLESLLSQSSNSRQKQLHRVSQF